MDSKGLNIHSLFTVLELLHHLKAPKFAWAPLSLTRSAWIVFGVSGLLLMTPMVAFGSPEKWPVHVWDPLFPKVHHYWHPPTIHFPIVFLLLESGVLLLNLRKRSTVLSDTAKYLLCLATVSFFPVVLAGLHDAGVDLGKANAIFAGFADRLNAYFALTDPVSIHVLFVTLLIVITVSRFVWRIFFFGKSSRLRDIIFAIFALLGCWIVIATAQVGGNLSHP